MRVLSGTGFRTIRRGLAACLLLHNPLGAQASSLADLRWIADETPGGRFVIASGWRAFVAGYNRPGLEVWTPPLQLARNVWISFREGDAGADVAGRVALRSIEQTPMWTTRIYRTADVTVRERIFTPVDLAAAAVTYSVESPRPVTITVHFTPTLNLMWPGGFGGQELHWDASHSAYLLDEPSHRFRGAVVSRDIVRHEEWQNSTRGSEFERPFAFDLQGLGSSAGAQQRTVFFAGTTNAAESPLAIADSLATQMSMHEARARARYESSVIEIETPDTLVNRALRWAQVTLEQAWMCNPQLGCGYIAGYGPSRGERRPQYAWFFGGDGLVTTSALIGEGAYARAREELEFILRYQNKRTGAIWHEMSHSAGLLDWEHAYPYMFVHVDISFDFLKTVSEYVTASGDTAFARQHWQAILAAYEYCRSTIPGGGALPEIPAGQQGMNEQDPQRDELVLSLSWIGAAEAFATLARLANHSDLAQQASASATRARTAIRPSYYDAARKFWLSGHLRSGAPVEGVTGSLIALLHAGMLDSAESRALLARLASPAYRARWGIRSTPSDAPQYDPDSYARGSVWAIGTADAVMAFYEAGESATATSLWLDLVPWFSLDAPGHMHEVLRGDEFRPERESVPDQTWSAASFVSSAMRGLLGLRVDAGARVVQFSPHLPTDWRELHVRRVPVPGGDVDFIVRRVKDALSLEVVNRGSELTVLFRGKRIVCPRGRSTLAIA
ncbi:MAG TPA: hypothetical protein VKH19_08090 [Gemmatimonadaceae bacterium]|nr:hypothetical protein [Gemmatimonadaceae bacterium]